MLPTVLRVGYRVLIHTLTLKVITYNLKDMFIIYYNNTYKLIIIIRI